MAQVKHLGMPLGPRLTESKTSPKLSEGKSEIRPELSNGAGFSHKARRTTLAGLLGYAQSLQAKHLTEGSAA